MFTGVCLSTGECLVLWCTWLGGCLVPGVSGPRGVPGPGAVPGGDLYWNAFLFREVFGSLMTYF